MTTLKYNALLLIYHFNVLEGSSGYLTWIYVCDILSASLNMKKFYCFKILNGKEKWIFKSFYENYFLLFLRELLITRGGFQSIIYIF